MEESPSAMLKNPEMAYSSQLSKHVKLEIHNVSLSYPQCDKFSRLKI